jgi:outer membrane autotransporter protein
MTTLRLPLSKTARLTALLLFCCCTLPVAHAFEWVISPTGSTALPVGGNTTAGSNLIKDGDIITLYTDPTSGGPTGPAALGNALITYQDNGALTPFPPSFTIRSGAGPDDPDWDGTWYTITHKKSPAPTNLTRAISTFSGNSTITLVNVIFAENITANGSGAAIFFAAGNAQLTDMTTLTGTAIFRGNGGSNSAMLGGAIHNAAGHFTLSGSFIFDSNFSGRGGAINTAANAGNDYIRGDILFVSNTTQTLGGAFNFTQYLATSTAFFDGNIRFIGNMANNGGAFASNIDANASASAAWVVFSGTTLFKDNEATANGGAIQQGAQGLVIGGNTTFDGNKAGGLGGAIYQFNNKSGVQVAGGAFVTLDATTGDILFQNNLHNTAMSPDEHNAMVLYSGNAYVDGGTTTVTLNATGGNVIYFHDPIAVSDTNDYGAQQAYVNVTQTGDGTVLFDTYQSVITHTTTLQSGTFLLTNRAVYGASNDKGWFQIEDGATVAGNGTVQAGVIGFADGARVNVTAGGTLSLLATTFTGTGLRISGHGTIDGAGGPPIPASLVSVGSTVSEIPGASVGANTAQTLTFAASAPLALETGGTLAFDMFGGTTSDHLYADALTFTSGSAFINLTGMSGTYNILTTLSSTFAPGDFTILINGYIPTQRYAATPTITPFDVAGSELSVEYATKNINIAWTGAAQGGIWRNVQTSDSNWTDNDAIAPELFFLDGDGVLFDDTAASRDVSIDAAGVVATSMTVAITTGNNYTFAGSGGIRISSTFAFAGTDVTPTGKLTKSGDGALNFTNTGTNTFEDGIGISGGAIGFTRAAQLGDGGNGIHFTGDATLRANAAGITLANTLDVDAGKTATLDTAANTLTYAGIFNLNNTGTLAKTGAGTLRLTADNSASTGGTVVRQGTLTLDGADAKIGGNIDIAAGATLAGSGSATGTVNAGPGAFIAPGASSLTTPVTLNLNNLNLDSSILSFNLFSTGSNDTINLAGALTLAGTNKINISLFQAGVYNLGNLDALAGVEVTIAGIAQVAGARQTAAVVADGGNLLLQTGADISRVLRWTGATSGTWISSDSNWTDGGPTTLYAGGDRVIFDDTAPAASPHDIDIAGTGLMVSDMFVQGTSSYSFSGAGITADPASIISGAVITTGSGRLIKEGSGTLAFTNAANNFLGGIEIDGGAITFTDVAQLGGGDILFGGDAALVSLTGAQTLASNITVAAGKTGVIDAGAGDIALSGLLAAAGGSGTLAKLGSGMLALAADNTAGAENLVLNIAEGSLLLDNVTFAGAVDLGENTTFIGAGDAGTVGAMRAAAGSTVQVNAGELNIGSLQLAGGSTLIRSDTGAGVLSSAATLDGLVSASITGGTLAFNGSINGAGGFLKTGDGELQLSGAAALGNTGVTQIDQGAVRITGISGVTAPTITESDTIPGINIAGTVSQNIMLNGGDLILSSGTGADEATANNWSGLRLIQGADSAASTISGGNEIIHVGSGTQEYAILQGIHVAVNAGNDTAVLGNTANNFTGIVRVDSGTLQVTDTLQLGAFGAATTAKVALNGGALQISGTINTTRAIELRADATVTVDDDANSQWSAITKPAAYPAASFTKAGSGTLTIAGNNQATGMTVAEGRYVAFTGNSVNTSATVSVSSGATFEFSATTTANGGTMGYVGGQLFANSSAGTVSAPVVGSGTLEITRGRLVFTSPNTTIANINITGTDSAVVINNNRPVADFSPNGAITVDQGALILASTGHNIGNVVLKDGASLSFLMQGTLVAAQVTETGTIPAYFTTNGQGFKTATLASLTATGTDGNLNFNTNLALGRADHLTVSAPVSGDFVIGVNNHGVLPETYAAPLTLLTAPDASDATFHTPPDIDVGLYKYAVTTQTGDGKIGIVVTGTGAMSNSASLINTMAGALPLSWFAELNSVTQRMGELHMETRIDEAGLATWVRGYGQALEFNRKVNGTPFDERQFAVEGGADYKFGGTPHNIYAGVFFGYGESERDYNVAGEGRNESVFGGLYETVSTKNGWYLDGVIKLNGFKNTFTAVSPTGETMTGEYHNWAAGGSLEFGKYCDVGFGWYLEPQIQGAITAIMDSHYVTSSGMQVELRSGTTTQGRVGFMFGRIFQTGANGLLHVYIKGHAVAQWTTNGQIYVVTPHGEHKRYTPTIKGDRLEVGAGIAWRASRRMQYFFDFETADADYYIKPWGVNFGIRCSW